MAAASLALVACGARDAGELFGASGPETVGPTSGGTGGAGGSGAGRSGSGIGGASTSSGVSSSSSAEASSSSSAEASSSSAEASSTSSGMPVIVTALPEGSMYRYWDEGSVSANWAEPAFDDSGWSQGAAPLGFGDQHIATVVGFGPNPNSKYITTWFRTSFNVSGAASVIAATLEVMRDDGARVFLNGTEAARSNMPNGAITSNTEASDIVDGNAETVFHAYTVDPALLVEGQNVLAIEVHQAVANSSDLGFDARVTLEQPAP